MHGRIISLFNESFVMAKSCQLYTYNADDFSCDKNSEEHFIDCFQIDQLDTNNVYWLNFHSLKKKEAIESFCDKQQIDKLVFDDIYTKRRRPKVEEYEDYIFFSIRAAMPSDSADLLLRQEQISFILGKNYLVSLQEKRSDHFTEVRERIETKKGKIREKGPDFLLFRMLDAITDNYYKVVEDIADGNRRLEMQLVRNPESQTLKLIEIQKRKLLELRKIALPLRDIALQLEKVESNFLSPHNRHYFTDLKENCVGVLDEIESSTSVLEGMGNLYYAVQGQRMNEIMKVLTIVSTIFIPLTFIAGIYGMNFSNMPELQVKNAYFYTLGGMVIIAVLLFIYFLRKGWLKRE